VLAPQRQEKRKKVTRRCYRTERLIVALDVLLKEYHVVTRRAAREPARCEVVHEVREVPAARMHVPRRNGERDRCSRSRRRNDVGANAGARYEEDTEKSGADPAGTRREPGRQASRFRAFYIAVAAFARAADASVAAARSIVADV